MQHMKYPANNVNELQALANLPHFQEALRQQRADKLAAETLARCNCLDEIEVLAIKSEAAKAPLEKAMREMDLAQQELEAKRGAVALAADELTTAQRQWQNAAQRLSSDHGEGRLSSALMRMHCLIQDRSHRATALESCAVVVTPWGVRHEIPAMKAAHQIAAQHVEDLCKIETEMRSLVEARCAPSELVEKVDALLSRAGLEPYPENTQEAATA